MYHPGLLLDNIRVIQNGTIFWPDQEDLDHGLLNLARIQFIYKLDVMDMVLNYKSFTFLSN